ncbi:hypothetical protein BAE44_0015582 [Dichanthelium oligosanthes]|uniref:Bowman-Birk serine protease inhibitors family domain-containing protein n=1 Tax=Dichanthelium oligosanthes TaxID=888268 RepID=A0A1E5VE44_9POAL|nr:hypothetical protein BAE44_0015582 [Dichanthelium oligosanthes]
MRNSHGGGRVCVVTALFVLLFGCLVLCAQCKCIKPSCRSALVKDGGETKRSYPGNSHLTTQCSSSSTANSTALLDDESKIKLVMCFDKGLRCVQGEPCYCCLLEQPDPHCYCTHSECEAKCPFCYPPPCSPPGTAVEGRALQAGTTNATLL